MAPAGRPRHGAGFTLVELLLALTLMSMLLALAYGGLRAATRATDRGQTILEDSSRIRMAHQFVHRQLNQIVPLAFATNEDGDERTVFIGEPDRIRFVAPMPGYLGFGGPQVQELAIVRGDDSLQLVLSHALLQGFEEERLYDRPPVPLLSEIDSASFSFLRRDEDGELAGWTSTWEEGAVLPESVSLDIDFVEDVYIQWPLLTASVKIDPAAMYEEAGLQAQRRGSAEDYGSAIQDMIRRRGNDRQ